MSRRQIYTSVVIGICTNNKDPEGLGRIKVRFPWLADSEESYWARVCQFMTGGGRGMWIIPEIDDEVLVAFEHGDVHHPYVLGSLWNGVDRPPSVSGFNEDGKNNIRMFQSRFGHQVIFDDTGGGEKIRLMEGKGGNVVDIFNPKNSHHYTANTGEIWIQAPDGTITIECTTLDMKSTTKTSWTIGKGYSVKVGNNVAITSGTGTSVFTQAPTSVDVGANTTMTAGGSMSVKATKVGMEGAGKVSFKSGILNLVAGINYGLKASKLSFDTGLFGVLRGVQHLNVNGGILAAIRGLILSMSTGKLTAAADLALVNLAGQSADFKGSQVLVNKAKAKAAAAKPGADPVKLSPPDKIAIEQLKGIADEQWNKLKDWARDKIKTEIKGRVKAEIAKIDNPYLQAAVGGAFGSAMDGGDLGDIGQAAAQGAVDQAKDDLRGVVDDAVAQIDNPILQGAAEGAVDAAAGGGDIGDIAQGAAEGAYDAAQEEGSEAVHDWIDDNVENEDVAEVLGGAADEGLGLIPDDLFGEGGLIGGGSEGDGAGAGSGPPPGAAPGGGV